MNKFILVLLGLCLLVFAITPVMAADPTCSFCEFINISKGDPGPAGPANMTMNMTANMTAGPAGASGGTGGQVLFFQHPFVSSPPTYEGLSPIPNGGSEADELVSPAGGTPVLFDSYITDIGYPGITILPAGLWRFRTYHYVSLSSGDSRVIFSLLNRTAGGTETPLFSVMSEEINQQTTPIEYLTSYTQTSNYTISPTDRIVINVYGNTTGVARDVHFVYQGSTHTSHVQTPLETISSLYIRIDGTTSFTGSQSMGSHNLTNVTDPTGLQDAATKNYVDTHSSGDTTSFLFTNGSRIMTGVFNAGKYNVSNITTVTGGDAVNLTLVNNMNSTMKIYIDNMNESIKNNMTIGMMNQTPNMTAGPQGNPGNTGPTGPMNQTFNLTMNMTANMTMNLTSVDTSAFLFLNGTRSMSGTLNMSSHNVSGIITSVGTDAVNKDYVDNVNTSMRNNVSQYILAVNETIKNNMSSLTGGFTNQTYVDNVNNSMRNNVSQYVILVNTTNMNNMSQYVLAVNETIKNNMSALTAGYTNQTYVDNVNASMRNNVSQYIILVNTTNMNNMSQWVNTVNSTMRNNVSEYVRSVNNTEMANTSIYVIAVNTSNMNNMSQYVLAVNETIKNNMTTLTGSYTNQTYVDNVNTSMRNNVSQYVISVNTSMKAYVDGLGTSGDTSNFLFINGSRWLTGDLNASLFHISNITSGSGGDAINLTLAGNMNTSLMNNVSQYVIAVNTSMKAYADALPTGGGDTSNFLFLNGSRWLTGDLNASLFHISNITSGSGGDAINLTLAGNMNTSNMNNMSQYVLAVNSSQNSQELTVNDTMRNNVSQYVIAVNNTQIANISFNNNTLMNNVSQYVISVNSTNMNNMSQWVNTVNTTMRSNVSQYVIAVNNSMRANESTYIIAVNNTQIARQGLARLDGAVTTTSLTTANITGLVFNLPATSGATIQFDAYINNGNSGTTGNKYAIWIPASSTLVSHSFGDTSGVTAFTESKISANGTLTTEIYHTVADQNGYTTIHGTVKSGGTGGTVQLLFASVTSGTTTANAGSYVEWKNLGSATAW